MTVVVAHLTNLAYGFPSRGSARRVKPVALACIHITGNSRTAAMTDLHAAAQGERNYANRAGSPGPSATHYIARDGWAIEAIDWRRYAAWSNGDVASPNTANAGIKRVLALRAKGYNANEAYALELENVGYGSGYPITAAQSQAMAALIAEASRATGLPVSRETVHGHWEINGVDRANCPCPPARHEPFLADLIARANAILAPATPEDDMPAITSYVPGYVATVKPTANVRSAPSLKATVLRVVSTAETWTITGWVTGDVDPDGGSNQWVCRVAGGRWEYTAKSNLTAGPTDPTSGLLDAAEKLAAAAVKQAADDGLADTAKAVAAAAATYGA